MSIYHASGIQGKAGDEIAPPLFRKLGRALAEVTQDGKTFAVGGDVRPTTPDLKAALIEGLVSGGCVVADVGVAPSPVAEFAGRMLRSDGVALVTGGCSAPDLNGLRFAVRGESSVAETVEELRSLVEGPDLEDKQGGEVESWEEDIADEYLTWLADAVLPLDNGNPMHVVLDPGNGALAEIARQAFEARPGVSVDTLFSEMDGAFPGRGPDCAAPGALDALAERVKEAGASLGIAFDATGSRACFVDERGRAVPPEAMGIVLLRHLRAAISGRPVVLDCRVAGAAMFEAKKLGARSVLARGDIASLTERAAREEAAFGMGVEGDCAYQELGGGADGLYTALRVFEMLRNATDPLSKLYADVPEAYAIRDVKAPCSDEGVRVILNRVRAAFPGGAQSEVGGGLRVRLEDGWAAALPCRAEGAMEWSFGAKDEETAKRIAADILDMAPEMREEARRVAGLPELPPPDPYAYLDDEET